MDTADWLAPSAVELAAGQEGAAALHQPTCTIGGCCRCFLWGDALEGSMAPAGCYFLCCWPQRAHRYESAEHGLVSLYAPVRSCSTQKLHTLIMHVVGTSYLDSRMAESILEDLAMVIQEGVETHSLQMNPHLCLLQESFYHSRMKPLLVRWMLVLWPAKTYKCINTALGNTNIWIGQGCRANIYYIICGTGVAMTVSCLSISAPGVPL